MALRPLSFSSRYGALCLLLAKFVLSATVNLRIPNNDFATIQEAFDSPSWPSGPEGTISVTFAGNQTHAAGNEVYLANSVTIDVFFEQDAVIDCQGGRGLYFNGALAPNQTIVLHDPTFFNCVFNSASSSCALHTYGINHISIYNGLFYDNNATIGNPKGGAVLLHTADTAVIVNSTFYDNKATHLDSAFGGALATFDVKSVLIDNCTFRNNLVSAGEAGGGAVQLHTGNDALVTRSTFLNSDTTAMLAGRQAQGGALFFYAFKNARVESCNFSDNSARSAGKAFGGALYIDGNQVDKSHVTGTVFYRNQARGVSGNTDTIGGGAMSTANNVEVIIRDCYFDSNVASGGGVPGWPRGGALLVYPYTIGLIGAATVISSQFVDNLSNGPDSSGGAIRAGRETTLNVEASLFLRNKAATGGAIHAEESTALKCASLLGNQATVRASAISVDWDFNANASLVLYPLLSALDCSIEDGVTESAASAVFINVFGFPDEPNAAAPWATRTRSMFIRSNITGNRGSGSGDEAMVMLQGGTVVFEDSVVALNSALAANYIVSVRSSRVEFVGTLITANNSTLNAVLCERATINISDCSIYNNSNASSFECDGSCEIVGVNTPCGCIPGFDQCTVCGGSGSCEPAAGVAPTIGCTLDTSMTSSAFTSGSFGSTNLASTSDSLVSASSSTSGNLALTSALTIQILTTSLPEPSTAVAPSTTSPGSSKISTSSSVISSSTSGLSSGRISSRGLELADFSVSPESFPIVLVIILCVVVMCCVVLLIVSATVFRRRQRREKKSEKAPRISIETSQNLNSNSDTLTTASVDEHESDEERQATEMLTRRLDSMPEPLNAPSSRPGSVADNAALSNYELAASSQLGNGYALSTPAISSTHIKKQYNATVDISSMGTPVVDGEYSTSLRNGSPTASNRASMNVSSGSSYLSLQGGSKELKGIDMGKTLGAGAFGEVLHGIWGGTEVACKSATEAASREELLAEASLLQALRHTNIVLYLGHFVDVDNDKLFLVFEFAEHGSVLQYIQDTEVDLSGKVRMLVDAAKGMAYLAQVQIVHRDLSCRNLLVAAGFVVKISDFGLSRSTDTYYTTTGGAVPVRWSAPEVLRQGTSSVLSDVFSFGITMHELLSDGVMPFIGETNAKVSRIIIEGKALEHLEIPTDCTPELYALIGNCLPVKTSERMPMPEILSELQSIASNLKMAANRK